MEENSLEAAVFKRLAKEKLMPQKSSAKDISEAYNKRTIDALNQFSPYTKHTPSNQLDLRCEFDVPRFKKLPITQNRSEKEEYKNFLWFQTQHDFGTPSNPKTESNLRHQILNLTLKDIQI